MRPAIGRYAYCRKNILGRITKYKDGIWYGIAVRPYWRRGKRWQTKHPFCVMLEEPFKYESLYEC